MNAAESRLIADYLADNPNCERCGAPTQQCHHIYGGACRVHAVWNLFAACAACHVAIHADLATERPKCVDRKRIKGEWDQAAFLAVYRVGAQPWRELL